MTHPAPLPPLRSAAALLVLLLGATAGCAREAGPPAPRSFTDDLGRTVALPHTPVRVVTLAPSLTEIVFTAGAGARLVAVGQPDDYPPAVDTLPRVSIFPVDFEAVAAQQPDLVLASADVNSPRDADTFAALGIPVVFLSFTRLADVVRAVRTVGGLLGTEGGAEAAAAALERRITALRARTGTTAVRPDVLFLIGDDVLYSFGSESYMHELIALAGGRSVMADVAAVAPVLSEEFVLTHRPDVIVLPAPGPYDPARLLRLHPTWDVVPAVRTGRVYGVDPDLFLRPGPRLVDAAERLAALLHPAPAG
jgi:iron complex transport system substrate-binding protein